MALLFFSNGFGIASARCFCAAASACYLCGFACALAASQPTFCVCFACCACSAFCLGSNAGAVGDGGQQEDFQTVHPGGQYFFCLIFSRFLFRVLPMEMGLDLKQVIFRLFRWFPFKKSQQWQNTECKTVQLHFA